MMLLSQFVLFFRTSSPMTCRSSASSIFSERVMPNSLHVQVGNTLLKLPCICLIRPSPFRRQLPELPFERLNSRLSWLSFQYWRSMPTIFINFRGFSSANSQTFIWQIFLFLSRRNVYQMANKLALILLKYIPSVKYNFGELLSNFYVHTRSILTFCLIKLNQ